MIKNIKNWVKSTEGKKVPLCIRIIGSVICINYLLMLVITAMGIEIVSFRTNNIVLEWVACILFSILMILTWIFKLPKYND